MVAVMILAFLAAWLPYSVLALLIAFGGARFSPTVSIIPALCAKSSICWNPIIYIGLNTQVNSAVVSRIVSKTVSSFFRATARNNSHAITCADFRNNRWRYQLTGPPYPSPIPTPPVTYIPCSKVSRPQHLYLGVGG